MRAWTDGTIVLAVSNIYDQYQEQSSHLTDSDQIPEIKRANTFFYESTDTTSKQESSCLTII